MATAAPVPTVVVAAPTDKPVSVNEKAASSVGNSDSFIDDDMAYDSDPDHAQDWTKTTDPKESWAVKERRRQTLFGKGPEMPNPHAATGKDRRGSVLSLFKTGKNQTGQDVLNSGFDDHPDTWEAKKETRSNSNTISEGRRGSILSMFQHTKDNRGRHVMNSGEWDHPVEEVVDVQAQEDRRRLAELKEEMARLEARVGTTPVVATTTTTTAAPTTTS